MWETIVVAFILAGVLVFSARWFYRAMSGKNDGKCSGCCSCSCDKSCQYDP